MTTQTAALAEWLRATIERVHRHGDGGMVMVHLKNNTFGLIIHKLVDAVRKSNAEGRIAFL